MMHHFMSLLRYGVAGGLAAATNLGILFVLTEYAHLHYLQSATGAFFVAFFVSFLLQKFWTFGDSRKTIMHWQMAGYLLVSILNLGINTILLFILVERFHIWYIYAAVLTGGLIAVETFFVYRMLIFTEHGNARVRRWLDRLYEDLPLIAVGVGMLLVGFISAYRLTESPPTWLDEGIITQVAINEARFGPHAVLQTAPGEVVSAGYVSTGYPATFPIAASFKIFGVGITQARAVMAVFILLFVIAAYWLAKKEMSVYAALVSIFLIASFAPLYGNGKNVLGEIPGLFYLVCFLLALHWIERFPNWVNYLVGGVFLGLAVATKPIFLLLLPAVGLVLLFSKHLWRLRELSAALLGFLVPMVLWIWTQFNGETLGEMFAIYANPHSNALSDSMVANVTAFLTKPEPLYALLLLGAWVISIFWRWRKKINISRAEYVAAVFAVLVYLAYLRGAPYYRYFFPGEMLALLYLPLAVKTLWPKRAAGWWVAPLLLLIALQLYQTLFSSWVAASYASTRSADIQAVLSAVTPQQTVFVYQAPELVTFLPTPKYYQYLKITDDIIVGKEQLATLDAGIADVVVAPTGQEPPALISKYTKEIVFDRYTLWYKKEQ